MGRGLSTNPRESVGALTCTLGSKANKSNQIKYGNISDMSITTVLIMTDELKINTWYDSQLKGSVVERNTL